MERHDPAQSRRIDQVEAGYFRLRLAKGAWAVPARIVRDPERNQWRAILDGEDGTPHCDPMLAQNVSRIWEGGVIITRAEYEWLLAVKLHYSIHDPEHPSLHPRRPVSPMRLKPIMPRGRRL